MWLLDVERVSPCLHTCTRHFTDPRNVAPCSWGTRNHVPENSTTSSSGRTLMSVYFRYPARRHVGHDNSVGTATRLGPDDPGIKSRWREVFPHPSRPALGPSQPPVLCAPGLFPGIERLGHDVYHPPPPSAEVKERVKLYLYPPLGLHGLF